jgi:hypothetical protein
MPLPWTLHVDGVHVAPGRYPAMRDSTGPRAK